LKKTDEFKRSFFSNTQSGSNTHSNPDQGANFNQRNLSTSGDDVLSQEGKKVATPTNLGGVKVVEMGSHADLLKNQAAAMTKLQEEMIKADEDLASSTSGGGGPALDLTHPISSRRI
jgi:hypothetical protein